MLKEHIKEYGKNHYQERAISHENDDLYTKIKKYKKEEYDKNENKIWKKWAFYSFLFAYVSMFFYFIYGNFQKHPAWIPFAILSVIFCLISGYKAQTVKGGDGKW